YSPVTDDSGKTVYIRETMTPSGMSVSTIDFSEVGDGAAQVSDILIDCYTVTRESGEKVFKPLSQLDTGMDILSILNIGYDTITDIATIDRIQQEIKNSDMSEAEKKAAMTQTYQTQTVNIAACLMKFGIVVAGSALVSAGTMGFGILAAAALLTADAVVDIFDMLFMEELLRASLKWRIDPSGYIYDAETGRRIHGAVVTVFWIPCEDPDETYWNNKPGEDTYGTPWNAAEYSLCNPMNTNEDGQYGWDVPEGWWRVRCEMTGYATVWSEWLPVPPPQLEVNLGMTRTTPAYTMELTDSGSNTASVLVTNTACTEDASHYYLAAYDENEKMIAVQAIEDTLNIGESLPMTISCDSNSTINALKLFILDDAFCPILFQPLTETPVQP
ncbi:MAG: hypothetical protein IIY00_03210, partial [Clostridia bacterium]|nr:hypothetical protein [Clostridia bacterium]